MELARLSIFRFHGNTSDCRRNELWSVPVQRARSSGVSHDYGAPWGTYDDEDDRCDEVKTQVTCSNSETDGPELARVGRSASLGGAPLMKDLFRLVALGYG